MKTIRTAAMMDMMMCMPMCMCMLLHTQSGSSSVMSTCSSGGFEEHSGLEAFRFQPFF